MRTGILPLLLALSFSSPTVARASTCGDLFNFFVSKPKIQLQVETSADGKSVARFFTNTSLLGRAGNQLLKWLHPTLKLDHFAESVVRFEKDPRTDVPYFIKMAEALQVQVEFSEAAVAAIPRTGPVLFFANHPLSGLDGLSIAALTSQFRTDIKVIANQQAESVFPGIGDHAIFVDTSGTPEAKQKNLASVERMKEHLRSGGALIIFPAGKVSRYTSFRRDEIADLEWRGGLLKLAEAVPSAALVPVYVAATPSPLYLNLTLISQKLSFGLVPSEVAKASLAPIPLRIGAPFYAQALEGKSEADQLKFLRDKVYDLAKPVPVILSGGDPASQTRNQLQHPRQPTLGPGKK